jgi:hypothetical protein
MKYPKKYKGKKTELEFPLKDPISGFWYINILFKDGSTKKTGLSHYEEEEHCWRPCLAFNKRIGYSEKKVKKIIEKIYHGQKEKNKKVQKRKKR